MIARLTGTLLELERNRLLLSPGEDIDSGVVYELLIPAYLAESLTPHLGKGGGVTLETIHYLEQQGQGTSFIPRLLGFGSAKEKAFFETFTTVKGLGMKRALRALAMPPSMIARMIAEGDARALQRLPEIGKKLADTIVLELKDSVDEFLDWSHASSSHGAASSASSNHSSTPSTLSSESSSSTNRSTPQPEAQGRGGGGGPGPESTDPTAKKTRSKKQPPPTPSTPIVESKPTTKSAGVGSNPTSTSPTPDPFLAARAAAREAVETLITLGEPPLEAERLVAKVVDAARRKGEHPPTQAESLLSLAYAAKRG